MSTYHVTDRSNGQPCYGIHDEHGLIASVYSEEAAYLFGVAPELLEALLDARREIQFDQRHDGKLTPLLERIDAAIAKARGEVNVPANPALSGSSSEDTTDEA